MSTWNGSPQRELTTNPLSGKLGADQSGDGYVKNTLKAVGIRPRILRSSRLLALVSTTDPKLVATAFGMTYDAVTPYLADRIDPTRLPNP